MSLPSGRSFLPVHSQVTDVYSISPCILTTNDHYDCGSTKFAGLGFTKHNFAAHYLSADQEARRRRDSRIRAYHGSLANRVLALQDDGYVEVDGEGTIALGHCWLLEAGGETILLEPGYIS